ncbi:MAG: hypothetical protein GWP06_18550 [Actinobacteria bacterium]|nr:hypothetical protein [Actinomycetota bacterium]
MAAYPRGETRRSLCFPLKLQLGTEVAREAPLLKGRTLLRGANFVKFLKTYHKANVQKFMHHLEENLVLLTEELAAKSYQPQGYVSFFIYALRRRQISAATFRDRVVHHALCNTPLRPKLQLHCR